MGSYTPHLIPEPLQCHAQGIVRALRVNVENPLHHLEKVDSSRLILAQAGACLSQKSVSESISQDQEMNHVPGQDSFLQSYTLEG